VWRSPILWGVLATVAVLAGFCLVVLVLGKPVVAHSLSLNEVGDFFSGMAAPLAFIWLVVAVFLQRHELQAQREQLEQQREELRLSREQLVAQAAELRAQSHSLRHQEEILDEGRRLSNWRAQTHGLLRAITAKVSGLERLGSGRIWWNIFENTNLHEQFLTLDQFEELSHFLSESISNYLKNSPQETRYIPDLTRELIEIGELITVSQSAGVSHHASGYELGSLLIQLERLQKRRPTSKAD
jgi:uncharacterized protein YhaN